VVDRVVYVIFKLSKMRDTPLSNCEKLFLLKAIEEKKVSSTLCLYIGVIVMKCCDYSLISNVS